MLHAILSHLASGWDETPSNSYNTPRMCAAKERSICLRPHAARSIQAKQSVHKLINWSDDLIVTDVNDSLCVLSLVNPVYRGCVAKIQQIAFSRLTLRTKTSA